MWYVFTDGKGRVSVIQADDRAKAEKLYRKYIGEANYTFIEASHAIRNVSNRTTTWKNPAQ
jgi:hypothetical protein